MKKIPTVLVRNPENRKHVLPEVTPGCEWVMAGEGVATRKYDGTCCLLSEEGNWWARREVKPGKTAPDDFWLEAHDDTTGKTVGWVPMETSAFARWHVEALESEPFGLHDHTPVPFERWLADRGYEMLAQDVKELREGYDQMTEERDAFALVLARQEANRVR